LTRDIIIYQNKVEANNETANRGSQRHKNGFEPLSQELLSNGNYKVTWVNSSDPDHSTNRVEPPRKMTQPAFIDELAQGSNVSIIGRIVAAIRGAFSHI